MINKRIMSMFIASTFVIPFFNFKSMIVKAQVSGQPSIPVAVGQPYQTTVNGQAVTAQDYEVTVPFIDSDITTHYYEQGYKDINEVLSKVPEKVKSTVDGQEVTFSKTNNVTFREDNEHDTPFPNPVTKKMAIHCGIEDYGLYQVASGGYFISDSDMKGSFPSKIPIDKIDTKTDGTYKGNRDLVWCGAYGSDNIPILANEPYQGFYPPLTGGTESQYKRRSYDFISDFSFKTPAMDLELKAWTRPVFIDVPQGQTFDASKSYEFDAITSNLLYFTYTPRYKDGSALLDKDGNPVKDVCYTTLSNPMTPSDLSFFYPDYVSTPSTEFTTRKIIDVAGSAFTNSGSVTRTNSAGIAQTVTRYTANVNLGRIQPSATYEYTANEDLWLPTVTYKATVCSTPAAHTLTVNYVDADNLGGGNIATDTSSVGTYSPTAPSGYALTGNYREELYGKDMAIQSNGSINENISSSDKTIYVMCRKSQETGTVVKKYFLDGIEQTADKQELKDVPVGSHTYSADKSYSGYTCSNPNVTVDVKANDTVYADFNYTIIPVIEKGTVVKRYFLKGVEQTADRQELKDVPIGPHTYSAYKTYPRYTCQNPSVTVNVTANSITYCDFYYGFENHSPTVHLYAPPTVVMGDNLEVNASGIDPDSDPLRYNWDIPSDFKGSTMNDTSSGYFQSIGNKTFSVTVTDPYNTSGYDSTVVKVIPPVPNVVIDKSGNEKENRKVTLDAEKYSSSGSNSGRYPLDWSKAQWQFFDGSGNELTVDSNPTSSTIVKSLDSTTGSKNMDLIFKKAGKYTAKCTLYNTAGYSNSFSVDLNIVPDLAPMADFYYPDGNSSYRDGKDLSQNGLSQGTDNLVDSSKSSDGDNIGKRMWFACFDSDNDGSYDTITNNEDGTKKTVPEKEKWFVYDLDYNGDSDSRYKVQVPDSTPLNGKLVTIGSDGHKYAYINDSLNPHWRYVGSYDDVKKLDINKINCGNLTNVSFKSTSCGHFYYAEVIGENFGQETIPQLITDKDKKQANTFEF